jgi:catechol 2,3-dioxygenase-like lactoylglutathione lyase family enzyme
MPDTRSYVGTVHHVSFRVTDLSVALGFYEGVLGCRRLERPDDQMPTPGAWLEAGTTQQTRPPDIRPPSSRRGRITSPFIPTTSPQPKSLSDNAVSKYAPANSFRSSLLPTPTATCLSSRRSRDRVRASVFSHKTDPRRQLRDGCVHTLACVQHWNERARGRRQRVRCSSRFRVRASGG